MNKCGICGSSESENLILKEKYLDYTLFECLKCKGQFWDPMKGPGNEWYEKDDRYSFRNRKPLKSVEKNHQEFLKDLPAKGGRLLDVGMGTGNFLATAIKNGYDGWGIDFDRDAIETAKKVFNLNNVYDLDIDGAIKQFGPSSFDVLTMFEVVEHLENPADFMGKAKQLLRSGGYLALSVPYRNAADFLMPHDKPPRHLTRWDEKAMKIFLESCGFTIVRSKIIPVPISYLVTKFHFWFKGLLSFGLVQKMSESAISKTESSERKQALRLSIMFWLAKAKDYMLFFLPAVFLKLYLFITKQNGLTLYVLAKYEE